MAEVALRNVVKRFDEVEAVRKAVRGSTHPPALSRNQDQSLHALKTLLRFDSRMHPRGSRSFCRA